MAESVSEPVETGPETAHEVESPAMTADDTIEVIEEHLADVPHSERTSIEYESTESTSDATESSDLASDDSEPDAAASHRIDPVPPSGFRLFGLGGKKKKGDEPAAEAPAVPSPAKAVVTASTFAPGTGLVEEEVIEGEEFEAPGHHHHKGDEHDLDEYEEETLQNQIRSGELGEMLQEAHLDHRIQLDFDDKNGEEERKTARKKGKSPSSPMASLPAHLARSVIAEAGDGVDVAVPVVKVRVRATAVVLRDAPRRLRICPSSATC